MIDGECDDNDELFINKLSNYKSIKMVLFIVKEILIKTETVTIDSDGIL